MIRPSFKTNSIKAIANQIFRHLKNQNRAPKRTFTSLSLSIFFFFLYPPSNQKILTESIFSIFQQKVNEIDRASRGGGAINT